MKRKHIFRSAAISLLLGTIVLCTTAFADKYQPIVRKLSMLESVLTEYYVGDVDPYKLQEGIYKGFVSGVGDTYSAYFTQKEYDEFKEESSGIYHGIGIRMYLEAEDNGIVIKEVFEGSPAETAGLLPNDKIIKVAGKNVSGNDFTTVSSLVGGEKDTEVGVTIFRPSDQKTHDFTVVRGNITYPTVNFKMLEGDIAYIQLKKFEELTHNQFQAALEKAASHDAKGMVLDLRNNPGGLLRIAKDIVDELIPEGIIVSTKDKNGKSIEYYADSSYTDLPMVVLINGRSASASEVVAGALKDYGRAKLVGETSYGKGVVQTIIPLSDGSALKITTAQYFTPSGVCIQGIGIDPDVQIGLPIEKLIQGSQLEDTEDDQLQTAIKVLRQEISE